MADASVEVQKAFYSAVVAAAAPVPVYDHVPQTAKPPYVQIGDSSVTRAGTKNTIAQEHLLTIQIFGDEAGRKSVKEIMARINDALEGNRLEVEGFVATQLFFVTSDAIIDAEGLRARVTASYKMWTS